jgi:hypothetical protein
MIRIDRAGVVVTYRDTLDPFGSGKVQRRQGVAEVAWVCPSSTCVTQAELASVVSSPAFDLT